MATELAIVDSGPLYAAADLDDDAHAVSIDVLADISLHLVIPALVVAEVTYLIGTRLGPAAEARFLEALAGFDVEGPAVDDWVRMAQLVEQYASFPLGGTDASIVALAERLGAGLVVTLDHRHFAAVRPHHLNALRLLPGASR